MTAKRTVKQPHGDAMEHLKKADPVLYRAALPHHQDIASGTHRRGYKKNDLFAKLAGSIVSQQLSTKAADTIWERLKEKCGGTVTPEAIKKLRTPSMRRAGLSAAKTKTLRELSAAILSGALDLASLKKLPEEEAIAKLTQVWGIGRWTAEMFLMFALEREDIFSPGDLGLLRAMETLYGIPPNSKVHVYEAIAINWSPYRTFACRVLWRVRDVPSPKSLWEKPD